MAVIDLRDDPARNARLLAGIGAGIGQTVRAFESEEDRLTRAIRQAFKQNTPLIGRAVREAQESDDPEAELAEIAGVLGVDPGVLPPFADLFPETFEEDVDRARRAGGLAEEQVETEVATAEAGQAGAEVDRRVAQAALEGSLPELSVLRKIAESEAGRELADREVEVLDEFRELESQLPPHMRSASTMAQAAPRLLGHVEFHENLDLQEKLANVRATAALDSPLDQRIKMQSVKSDLQSEFDNLEDRLREGDFEEGQEEALLRRYNDLANDWAYFFPESPVTILNPLEEIIGKDIAGVSRFVTLMPDDLRATIAAAQIASGQATEDDLMETLTEEISDPEERQEVFEKAMNRVEFMKGQLEKSFTERAARWALEAEGLEPGVGRSPTVGKNSLRIPTIRR